MVILFIFTRSLFLLHFNCAIQTASGKHQYQWLVTQLWFYLSVEVRCLSVSINKVRKEMNVLTSRLVFCNDFFCGLLKLIFLLFKHLNFFLFPDIHCCIIKNHGLLKIDCVTSRFFYTLKFYLTFTRVYHHVVIKQLLWPDWKSFPVS